MTSIILKDEFIEKFKEIFLDIVFYRGFDKAEEFENEVMTKLEKLREYPQSIQIEEYPFRSLKCDKNRHHIIYIYDDVKNRIIVTYIMYEKQDKEQYFSVNKRKYKEYTS